MTATAPQAAGVVERHALFDLLDRGVQGPVTLVCAPAGSGKTMLIRSWLETRGPSMAVARLAVGSDEGDATRFWGAVTDALRRSGAITYDDPLATLASAPMGGQREFVARLIEGLARVESPVLLILDDLEQLRSEEALEALGHLLEQAPEPLRCLLISLTLRRRIQIHSEHRGFSDQDDAIAYVRFVAGEEGGQLLLRRALRQDQVNRVGSDGSLGAGCPGERFTNERVFHGRDQVRRESLVGPAGMFEVPRFKMRVFETPRGHLFHGPFGGGLVVWRTRQARTVNVREHVHSFHDLRTFHGFLANTGQHVAAAVLSGYGHREQ